MTPSATQPPVPPIAGAPVDVAALVERFAPIGRHRRRQQRVRRYAGLAALCILPVVVIGIASQVQLDGKDAVPDGTAALAARAALEQQSADITARVAELRELEAALAVREQALQQRDAELVSRLAELEGRQRSLDEAQLAFERAQRADAGRRAPSRVRPVEAEPSFGRKLVEQELAALKSQRSELEQQRQALDTQRQQLQDLMDRYAEAASERPASTPVPVTPSTTTSAVDETSEPGLPEADADPLLMTAVTPMGDEALGNTRGAFRVGPDLDVSFGLTRSASLNGVEQYSSSIRLDGVEALSNAGLTNTGPLIIQNGPGNVIAPEVLDALSGSLGTVIQNTLDTQVIDTKTVIDISIGNVDAALDSITGSQVVSESLFLQRP